MSVRQRIIQEEVLVFVLREKVHGELVHEVGYILAFGQIVFLTVDVVEARERCFVAPVFAAVREKEVFVEAPLSSGRE